MKTVHIYPIGAGPDKGSLSYFTMKDVAIGDTVQIAIRGKKVLGIVDGIDTIAEDKSSIKSLDSKMKKIEQVFGQTLHGGPLYTSAKLLARYYISHPGLVLSAIRPAIFDDPALKDIKPPTPMVVPVHIRPILIQTSKNDRIVYFKKLIREYFAKKESVAIILPTVQEAKLWRDTLSKGITEHTIFFTGEENKKAQRNMIRKAATTHHPLLLVGTFFAAVLPVPKLGAIIVEHESSSLYETRRRPIIDRRLAAEAYAYTIGATLYFSDAMLEIKMSGRVRLETANTVEKLSFRMPHKSPDIVDLTEKRSDKTSFRALSAVALSAIKEKVDNSEHVLIFALRKNYASTTVCKDCGEGVVCPTCGHALALMSDSERVFYCAHCDEKKSPSIVCTRCGSWNLVPLGIGIDRVKEELVEAGFGDTIARIDGRQKDTEMDMAARDFADRKKKILLGTEAAFSRLPETGPAGLPIDLTIVASLDSLFAMPLWSAPERATQLLMRIAEFSKRTIVQTRYPEETVLEGAKRGTFSDFAESEYMLRQSLGYPPFRRLINLSFSGTNDAAEKATKKLETLFADFAPEFFEMPEGRDRTTVRMQMKIDPELWPLIPRDENDVPDEELYLKLAGLPRAIKVDIE